MISGYSDPLEVLLNLQRALDSQTSSGWLQNKTASQGPFPPINVFQQGDDILAIIELPGVEKKDLQIQAQEKHHSHFRQESRELSGRQRPPAGAGVRGIRSDTVIAHRA